MGDVDEQGKLENLFILDRIGRRSWSTLRVAQPGRYCHFFTNRYTAATISTGHRISHCVEHSLRVNGCQRRQDLALTAFSRTQHWVKPVYYAIGGKLFLESDLLQCPSLRFCIFVAAIFVGAGVGHDPDLSES